MVLCVNPFSEVPNINTCVFLNIMTAPKLKFPKFKNNQAKKAVIYEGSILWNNLPNIIRKSETKKLFNSRIDSHFKKILNKRCFE